MLNSYRSKKPIYSVVCGPSVDKDHNHHCTNNHQILCIFFSSYFHFMSRHFLFLGIRSFRHECSLISAINSTFKSIKFYHLKKKIFPSRLNVVEESPNNPRGHINEVHSVDVKCRTKGGTILRCSIAKKRDLMQRIL